MSIPDEDQGEWSTRGLESGGCRQDRGYSWHPRWVVVRFPWSSQQRDHEGQWGRSPERAGPCPKSHSTEAKPDGFLGSVAEAQGWAQVNCDRGLARVALPTPVSWEVQVRVGSSRPLCPPFLRAARGTSFS